MADGSVVIGVSVDTANFYRSVEMIESRINGLSSSMGASLASAFSGEQLFVAVEQAFSRISTAAASSYSELFDSVTAAAEGAADRFRNSSWQNSGKAAAEGIASGISSGFSAIAAAVSGILSRINSAFSSGWREIGRNVSAGIAAGMLEGADRVLEGAESVADQTTDVLKERYKIASPSALMRDEIGVMISRGIAEGITDGAPFIQNALSSVYATDSALSARGSESAVNRGNLTQNIYLRDSDYSPYRTARRIRKESEAIFEL